MRKTLALTALVLTSTSLAQTWDTKDGKLTLVGCYGKEDGVYCDFSFVLTKKRTATLSWYSGNFKVFRQDGAAQVAHRAAFMDGNFGFYSSGQEIISDVPVKVQAYFSVPGATTSFRALSYGDIRFDNIPVRPFGSAPVVPAQLQAPISVNGYTMNLSNCRLQGVEFVCNATATPTK